MVYYINNVYYKSTLPTKGDFSNEFPIFCCVGNVVISDCLLVILICYYCWVGSNITREGRSEGGRGRREGGGR